MNRRTLLAAGATGLATALAGCTGGGADDEATTETTSETTETTSTTESTDATTATTTDATTTTATDDSGDDTGTTTTVTVAPGGELEFSPQTVTVDAGTTVRWEWDGSGHNVRPASQPADADWPGTAGGDGETYGSGHGYEYTFEVAGRYDYYCAPHRSVGMRGAVVVE